MYVVEINILGVSVFFFFFKCSFVGFFGMNLFYVILNGSKVFCMFVGY